MDRLQQTVDSHQESVYLFFKELADHDRRIILRSDIREHIERFCQTEVSEQR